MELYYLSKCNLICQVYFQTFPKQRIAREGEGKRSGFRTIIIFHSMERAFFVYGFPKNKRDNIQSDEKEAFKKLAAHLLNIPDESIEALIEDGAYIEVNKNGETI